ncbi:unnamed protein product [Cylicostephanus goldi]|uniref:glucuronosyltransferase n=1 Tax=Cylicostephanus goldi TaxID=71465 RepID=A0A3P6R2U8_CYLGO|nr:unnamed protein product [Cylicostephanus goldi]
MRLVPPGSSGKMPHFEKDLLRQPLLSMHMHVFSADPRVTAFISHGGLGSTTEIAHMGKPAIMVPLFADQTRNANMLARHGGALVLDKYDLANHPKVKEIIQRIISDESYATNAKLLADVLVNQPISAKNLMLLHAEFAARLVSS